MPDLRQAALAAHRFGFGAGPRNITPITAQAPQRSSPAAPCAADAYWPIGRGSRRARFIRTVISAP